MVASKQIEIPFYRSVGRQRGHGFGALAQVIGRTSIEYFRKYIVSAAKGVVADLLDFATPVIALVANGKKIRNSCKEWEDQLWENSWVVVAGKRLEVDSFQQNLQKKSVNREVTFSQTFPINLFEQTSLPTFCRSFWKSWRESPNSWQCVVPRAKNLSYYLARWKLHRVWISKRSELLFWFKTDLVLKLNVVKGHGYETYKTKEMKKEPTKRSKSDEEATEDEKHEAAVLLFTQVNNNFLHSIFSNVEVYLNNQQIYNFNELYEHRLYTSNKLNGAISEYKGVFHFEWYDYKKTSRLNYRNAFVSSFFIRRRKILRRPDGFMLYGNLGVEFFSTSELLNPILKIRLRLITARPNFYMINDNPNLSLGILDSSHYTRRITLKADHHKKRMDMLADTAVEVNYL